MAETPKKQEKSVKQIVSNKLRAPKRTLRQEVEAAEKSGESLSRTFWRGFTLPIRLLWRGLAWLTHRPPLKQIGHAFRWFFGLKPFRFIAKILGISYIYNSVRELRSVTWPSFRESLKLTSAVLVFSVIFGLFIALVDFGLDKLFKQVLLK